MAEAAGTSNLIQQCALAGELGAEDCEVLGGVTEVRRLDAGEVLFEESQVDETVYIVISGKLAVTKQTGGGADTILHIIQDGDLAGEMGFVDGTPHSATVKAVTPAQVVSLHRGTFESLLDTHPRVVYDVMRAIIRRVHGTLRRMNFQYVEMTNYITRTHGRY
jgi:CRP-like cAMP-binding protein